MTTPELLQPNLNRLPPLLTVPGNVRLVKDCLRVGRWLVGVDAHDQPLYWDVTAGLLKEIVSNFDSQYAAGVFHPLQWGHAAAKIGSTELSSIQYIRHLWIEGDTLYFGVYVTPDEAAEIQRKHRQVSVRVVDQWQTQAGQSWGTTLIHVAIVDHGAIPSQFPFVELSAMQTKSASIRITNQRPFVRSTGLVNSKLIRKKAPSVRLPAHVIRQRIEAGLKKLREDQQRAELEKKNQARRRFGLPEKAAE